jgi:hypothetical protein
VSVGQRYQVVGTPAVKVEFPLEIRVFRPIHDDRHRTTVSLEPVEFPIHTPFGIARLDPSVQLVFDIQSIEMHRRSFFLRYTRTRQN